MVASPRYLKGRRGDNVDAAVGGCAPHRYRDTLNRRKRSQRPLLSFVLVSVQLSASCLFNTYVFNITN